MIRAATDADLAALAPALAGLPLLARYGSDAARLARDLAAARGRGDGLVVAHAGGPPLGLAWFLREGTLAMGAYLRLMAVRPEAQARGVGAELLAAFEVEAAAAGRHAFLLCADFNAAARRFYERHGWRPVGPLPGLVLPGVAEVLYWKRVGGAGPPRGALAAEPGVGEPGPDRGARPDAAGPGGERRRDLLAGDHQPHQQEREVGVGGGEDRGEVPGRVR